LLLETKEKDTKENKMEKKSYRTFPDHWDVQLISSTLSSLESDGSLAECFTLSGSLLAYFEISS
jgi:hypothetical protein